MENSTILRSDAAWRVDSMTAGLGWIITRQELAEKVGHSTSVVRKRFDDMTRKKHVSKWTNEEDDTLRKMMVEERKDHSILNTMAQKMKKRQDRVWRAMGLVEVRRRKSKAVSRRTGEQG
uniref:Myb-like domain-containing protein n=1 Tax=Brassica campestris TaxID=3711 RepID=A0A3P6AKV5_BRACM|nr:unnamed protein product [Brassica rapa]